MSWVNIQIAILRFVLCFLGSVLAGFIVFGSSVFNSSLPQFQFVGFGIVVALFAAVIPTTRARWLILLGFAAYFGLVISAGSETSVRLIRDALGVVSIISATWVGVLIMRRPPILKMGKFVFWAVIFAVAQVLAVSLLAEIQSVGINREFLFIVAKTGALIGAGSGLGFELANMAGDRLLASSKQQSLSGTTA